VVTFSDKFHWFKHKKPLKKIPPKTDICIACSVSDIKPMLKKMPKHAKAFWYCRLLEKHQMDKEKIVKYAGKVKTLVNSECLQRWFADRGVKTTVVYQGIDAEKWHDEKIRGGKKVIGFLLSKKPRKYFKEIKAIVKQLGDKYDYVAYGAKQDIDADIESFISKKVLYFKANASHGELLRLYNMAHIWLATSRSEGLHNPPQEAALCGCALVCSDARLNGTSDYAIDGETAWTYPAGDIDMACESIEAATDERVDAARNKIITKIGNRTQAMKHLLEVLNEVP